jgi:hypothetical protein
LLVWLSKNASQLDPIELKTDLQTKNMVSASATTVLRRLRDADSYACNPAKKYLIQEKNRPAPNLPIFCQKVDNSNVQFRLKFQINRLGNKKVMPKLLNDRSVTFDRYCIYIWNQTIFESKIYHILAKLSKFQFLKIRSKLCRFWLQ